MENWKNHEFSQLVTLVKDKHDGSKSGQNHPCIELEHIAQENGRLLGFTDSTKQASIKNKFTRGDVLFGKLRPYLRKYWLSDFEGVCSSEIWVFRANEEICKKEYLFYLIQSYKFIQATRVSSGSKMPRADWDWVAEFVAPIPPFTEQKKIAAILSTWDSAIETCEKLIAAKLSRKRVLMQQLLTGKKRFPEFVKSTERTATRYFSLPKDWRLVRVGEIAREVSAKNKKGGALTVLSCTKYKGLVDSLSYFGKQIYSQNLSTYKIVKRGEFAYATNHIEEGSIGYQNLYDEALISPMYTVFDVNEEIDHSYLFKLLKTETFRHIFEANTSGSIDRRGALRWEDFANIKIPLPSLEEQKRIAEVLDTCDAEINLLTEKLEALKNQKRGLMQQLLTGKVRVKVDENTGDAVAV